MANRYANLTPTEPIKDNFGVITTGFDRVQGEMDLAQRHKLTQDNGKGIRIASGVTKLSDIRSPGRYYMTTAESSQFTDHPMPGVAGWWMEVGQGAALDEFYQKISRNSADYNFFYRNVQQSGVRPWVEILHSGKVEEYSLPLAAGMVNYKTITGSYDCIIYKFGNVFTIIFSLTNHNGNFTRSMQIAAVPVGLRPRTTFGFSAGICAAPDPNGATSPELGVVRMVLYTNGNLQIFNDPSLQGNRLFGSVTYVI